MTIGGDVSTPTGTITLQSEKAMQTTGVLTADKDVKLTSTDGAITTGAAVTAETGKIEAKANGNVTTNEKLSAAQGVINLTSNAESIVVKAEAIAKGDVTLEAKAGSVGIDGAVTSMEEDVTATAQGAVTTTAEVKANQNVTLTSSDGAITTGEAVTAETGDVKATANGNVETNGAVQAQSNVLLTSSAGAITTNKTVTAVTGKIEATANGNVTANEKLSAVLGTITLTSDAGNVTVGKAGEAIAKGDVTLEAKAGGVAIDGALTSTDGSVTGTAKNEVTTTAEVKANQNVTLTSTEGVMTIGKDVSATNGNIALKSDGNMQTIGTLTAAKDVKLTSGSGDVAINGDVTTGTQVPEFKDTDNDGTPEVIEPYNALVIHAGGTITEAKGVKIKTPVVETYSGKGVSMESNNNTFGYFLADALEDSTEINGSVKVVSNYAGNGNDALLVGVGASVRGDAEFTNLDSNGGLDILILHPTDENKAIKILGGNGAEGNLVLQANNDVDLLGDANAAHDVEINSTDGSFSGIGRGIQAGNDVNVSVGEGVYYMGGVIQAGNDIDIQVKKPVSEVSGIYIGALPAGMAGTATGETSLTAGHDARFDVQGDGNILLEGSITAGKVAEDGTTEGGDVVAKIDDEGSVLITGSVESKNGDVSVQTGEGHIYIGTDKTPNEETVKAKNNVTVGTNLGTIYIQGETSTKTGDITMTAGKDAYEQGTGAGNFIIRDDGKLNSGGGVVLNGRNGDIEITDDIQAKKGITVNIAEQGNASFGRDVSVTNDVNISTDKGTITVGHTVNSDEGDVNLHSGNGNILVGQDITAGQGVSITSQQGNVVVGDATTGNEGDILAENGDVSIQAGQDVVIVKTITAQDEEGNGEKGNINITSGQGDITVGADVTADTDVDMKTTVEGDITVGANVTAGNDVSMETAVKGNILVGQDITAGQAVSITSQQGSVVVGDVTTGEGDILAEDGDVSIQAGQDVSIVKTITAQGQEGDIDIASGQGDIIVGNTVNSDEGNVSLQSGNGDILVGQDITAGQAVSITSQQGSVVIGDVTTDEGDILAKNGDVSIQTGQGTVAIVKTVTAQKGSIDVESGKGDILIGDNGADVKTVSAEQNVKLATQDGTIVVSGKTETRKGDITVLARDEDNNNNLIINGINLNGELYAGAEKNENPNATGVTGNLTLQTYNGDIVITDYTKATGGIKAKVENKGSIGFGVDVNTDGDLNFEVDEGDIIVGNDITATGDISLTTGTGSIVVGANAVTGAINKGNVESTQGNVNISTGQGDVKIVKTVTAQQGSIDVQVGTGGVTIGNNGKNVETVTAKNNIDIGVELGQVKIYGKTSTKEGDISMAAGENQYTPGTKNFIIEQNGLLESGRDINLTGRNGDLHVTDAIQANRNLNAQVNVEGGVIFDESATLTGDVTVQTETGPISIAGQVNANLVDLVTGQGDVSLGKDVSSNTSVNVSVGTGNVTTENVTAKNNVNVTVQNGNIQMHDVTAEGTTTITNTGRGNINGNNIISGGTTHVSLTDGDLFLNLAEGKAVVLRMENNTAASRVNTVKADASGGAGLDVELTGNFIQIGTIEAKGGNSVLQLSAIGAGNQKLISGEISVGSLRSANGTHMPSLWANRGNVHVDEGNLAIDDVLAKDKIHLENNLTDLAIFGRTPTRDGEQLYYWNNLGRAYSKTRPFALYTDGKVRTHRAVLVDAGRYYDKLYGDNLSVVDMMRERLTNEHGQYTFDRTWFTKPGEALLEKVLFGMEVVDIDIRKHNASNGELL